MRVIRTCMNKVMFLKVGKLRETLCTDVALEGPLSIVCPQVNFQIGQLTKRLVTHIAFVVHLAVFLLEWIRQRSVTPGS